MKSRKILFKKKKIEKRGAWLAQSTEHMTLNLRVMSSSPTLGVEPTKKKKKTLRLAMQKIKVL